MLCEVMLERVTMSLLRIVIASVLFLFGCSAVQGQIHSPRGYEGDLFKSTLALYGHKGAEEHFLCTATVINKTPDGYDLLTAGHCIRLNPQDVQYAVSDDIGGPQEPVEVLKSEMDDKFDFALLKLHTGKQYTPVPLGTVDELTIGDETINVNFTAGLGKQLSRGVVSSGILSHNSDPDLDTTGTFIDQEFSGPGASGSSVVSKQNHNIVGIAVAVVEGVNLGVEIESIDKFQEFMDAPEQPWKAPVVFPSIK